MVTEAAAEGGGARDRRHRGRWLVAGLALLLLPLGGWLLLRQTYHSWHPCDWLLVDRVSLILRRHGIDPDTASIPLKATVTESSEVRAVLQLRSTPGRCLVTWAAGRVMP